MLESVLGGKAAVAQNLKQSWRNSPLAGEHSRYRMLDLVCDDPIPALSADFSHVRDLYVRGRSVTDANVDALLANFPKLRRLRINGTGNAFTTVPQVLSSMPDLTGLSLYSAAPFAGRHAVETGCVDDARGAQPVFNLGRSGGVGRQPATQSAPARSDCPVNGSVANRGSATAPS